MAFYNSNIGIALHDGRFNVFSIATERLTDIFYVGLTIPWPSPKTSSFDVPGMNGKIDLTDVHGGVTYSNRLCTLDLVQREGTLTEQIETFVRKYNGKKCVIEAIDDGFMLVGRLTVTSDDMKKNKRKLTCLFDAEPLKITSAVHEYTKLPDSAAAEFDENQITFDSSSEVINLSFSGGVISYKHRYTNISDWAKSARVTYRVNAGSAKILLIKGTILSDVGVTRWKIIDSNGNLVFKNNDYSEVTSGFVYIGGATMGELFLTVNSTRLGAFSASSGTTSVEFEILDVTQSAHIFVNKGEDTYARYRTEGGDGSAEIFLNDVIIKPINTNGDDVIDPRLIIKNGNNIVYFKHVAEHTLNKIITLKYREGEL